MPATPQVTIFGTCQDVFGVANVAKIIFTLAGYGNTLPRVSGTSMLVSTQPLGIAPDNTGFFSVTLWGNDVITPGPNTTYYTLTLQDARQNTLGIYAYQFNGVGSIDLSAAAQFAPGGQNVVAAQPVVLNPAGVQTIVGFGLVMPSLQVTGNVVVAGSITGGGLVTVAFAAAPTFDASQGCDFEMTLTGNVVGPSVISNTIGGRIYTFTLIQDGVGNRTFVWPVAVKNASIINPALNSISVQSFIARNNGNLYPIGPMTYN
jgi:hypothetical protein